MFNLVVRSIVGSTVAILCFGIYAIHLGTHTAAASSTPHAFFAGHAGKVPAKVKSTFDGLWWNVFLYLPTAVACLTRFSPTLVGMTRTLITLIGTGLTLVFFVKSSDVGLLIAAVCIYVFVSNGNMPVRVGSIGAFAVAASTGVISFK
jgi:hypothetical protein